MIYAELDYQTEKNKNITCQLESLPKKPCIDSSHYDQFTLGKLICAPILLYNCHITDHVNKLEVILQPMEDDWYLLGQQLKVEESVLADIHKLQKDVQMKCLLQKWCTEGGSLTKLENALIAMDRKDLISSK